LPQERYIKILTPMFQKTPLCATSIGLNCSVWLYAIWQTTIHRAVSAFESNCRTIAAEKLFEF